MTAPPPTGDEIAGVVDLFGALTRQELRRALREVAFRAGREFDAAAARAAVDSAEASYRLVAVDPTDVGIDADGPAAENDPGAYVAGPTAFPTLPDGGEDLPHILDVEHRTVDRAVAGEAALGRFRVETAAAVDAGDEDRIRRLLDVSYDLEAWAPVELDDLRDRLDDAVDAPETGRGGERG